MLRLIKRLAPLQHLNQPRFGHTDIKVPDFSNWRHKSVQSPCKKASDSEDERRLSQYLISGSLTVVSLYAAKSEIIHYVQFMATSADVLALAKAEIKLSEIPEGKNLTVKWRGKPLFIKHRTPADIAAARAVPMSELRHPEEDSDRCIRPEFLVVIGVCTHLGCVPIADAGDFGGYYCPCHGSHFDISGRIRKGPAPINLNIPPHSYLDEDTLIVG